MERTADGTKIADWTDVMTAALTAATAADVTRLKARVDDWGVLVVDVTDDDDALEAGIVECERLMQALSDRAEQVREQRERELAEALDRFCEAVAST